MVYLLSGNLGVGPPYFLSILVVETVMTLKTWQGGDRTWLDEDCL